MRSELQCISVASYYDTTSSLNRSMRPIFEKSKPSIYLRTHWIQCMQNIKVNLSELSLRFITKIYTWWKEEKFKEVLTCLIWSWSSGLYFTHLRKKNCILLIGMSLKHVNDLDCLKVSNLNLVRVLHFNIVQHCSGGARPLCNITIHQLTSSSSLFF